MVDTHEEDTTVIKQTTVEEPVKQYRWHILGGIVLLALIVGGIIYYVKHHKKTTNTTSLDEIRNAFPSPTTTMPDVSITTSTPPSETVPPTSPVIPIAPPAQPALPPVPKNFVYSNSQWNFSITLPGSWQFDPTNSTDNKIVLAGPGGAWGYIEAYPNTSGETLDTLTQTLQGSPSVKYVSQTTVAGQPAIAYYGYDRNQDGVAVIYGNTIYYIHGGLTARSILSTFSFSVAQSSTHNY